MSLVKEFKEFAMRGNVVDLAVGVIIGTAFGKVVSSMVNDILMPPIGVFLGGMDFSSLAVTLKEATAETPATVLKYGMFINSIIDFLIVAAAIFAMIRLMNSLRRREDVPVATPVPVTKECPECLTPIPANARRCAHCTSVLC